MTSHYNCGPLSDTLVYTIWLGVSVLTRVLVAFACGNVPLTMTLNAMHNVGTFARVTSSSYTKELESFLTLEITCFVAVWRSALFESLCRRQTRATLEASLAADPERTATELLSLVRDAVVTLDDEWRTKQLSLALEALLFNTTTHGLCGVDFEELVCDDTCDRFEAFMTDRRRARCLHVHLRDASGIGVAVQLFHSRLRGLGGQISHLVGIQEQGDVERTRQPPDILMTEDAHFGSVPTTAVEDQSSN